MSSLKKSKYRLTGVAPLIYHNGQLANPRNYFAKAIKEISSKKKKTEADLDKMAELEFKGSLYCNEEGRVIMPSDGIEAIVRSGARKSKEGKVSESGVFCTGDSLLEYDGPQDADKLWGDDRFVSVAGAKINQSRVMRTRPKFTKWSVVVEIAYNPEVCNEEQIFNWLKVAGEQCGAFDWRPKHGRFTVERVKA
jgi:hypothetical protein